MGVALGQAQAIPVVSYVGLITLPLALIGGWRARTPGRVMALLLGCLCAGSARHAASVLRLIPLLNQLPGTDRWSMVLGLVLPLLAGCGLQELTALALDFRLLRHEQSDTTSGWAGSAECSV